LQSRKNTIVCVLFDRHIHAFFYHAIQKHKRPKDVLFHFSESESIEMIIDSANIVFFP